MENLGLQNVTPIVLGDAGNLIVRLTPYPIVARVAKRFDDDDPDFWREKWAYEVKVSQHLTDRGVPVVQCSNLVPTGPHKVADTWMTLWEYLNPVSLPKLSGKQAINTITTLVKGMSDFRDPLLPLEAWRNANQAAEYLYSTKHDDSISRLLSAYELVNERIHREPLYPAHGDAHRGNLISSSTGWRWIDFEDVSLMPKFWDYASFIGNFVLFHGLRHPVVESVLQSIAAPDQPSFQFALEARVIMAPMTNLALALHGHGDLDFAKEQLHRAVDFLITLNSGSLWD